MELRHLQYFCEAARQEHFSRAAEALYISQPALSRTIKDLEEELGTALFEPAGRGVRLTPAGKYFYEVADQILEDLKIARHKLRQIENSDSSIKIVNEIPEFSGGLLQAFLQRYPEIPVTDSPRRDDSMEALFTACCYLSYGEPRLKGLYTEELISDTIVLLVPAQHRFAGCNTVPMGELKAEPFIAYAGIPLPKLLERAMAYPDYLLTDFPAVVQLVSHNRGISAVPSMLRALHQKQIRQIIPADNLPLAIPLTGNDVELKIYISWPADVPRGRQAQLFIDFCHEYFRNLQEQARALLENT